MTRLRLVTCDEMILIQLQTRDDISFLNSRIFSNSTFLKKTSIYNLHTYIQQHYSKKIAYIVSLTLLKYGTDFFSSQKVLPILAKFLGFA